MADVIKFPRSAEDNIDEFISQLTEAKELIGHMSLVITVKDQTHSFVRTYNSDAGMMAFHLLCLQRDAMIAANLIPDPENDNE